MADAGLKISDIDGIFTAGQHSPALLGEALGVAPRYVDGTSVGGCSFIIMVGHALLALHHGLCDVAVVSHGESGRSGTGVTRARDTSLSGQFEMPYGFGGAPTYFGMITTRHMHDYGTTLEQWADVAVSTRAWACLNPKAKFREPKGKAVNILLPDGKRATGRELPSGELKIVGEGGALTPAPPGALKMTLQAAPGELPDAALNRKVIQVKTTARNFVRIAVETLTFLRNPKTVLGAAGGGIRFAQSLKAQAGQLARAFSGDHFDGTTGSDLTVAQMLDPKRYNFEGIKAISAATTRVKANIVAMAYIIARARDPSGRLSDFDVQVAMESLGFDSNDKDIIAATISDRVREVTENSANFIEISTGTRPDLPTLPAKPAPQKSNAMTIEELEAIARGRN